MSSEVLNEILNVIEKVANARPSDIEFDNGVPVARCNRPNTIRNQTH